MNFLVTGSNGFIGQHVVNFIKSLNGNILTIGRFHNKENTEWFLNIEDIDKPIFAETIQKFKPNYIFHIAGDSTSDDNITSKYINVTYGLKILDILEYLGFDKKVKCLFFGTAAEYGKILPHMCPLKESINCKPVSIYGESKLQQTVNVLNWSKNGRKITVVRPFSIIGENMPQSSALGNFINQIKNNKDSNYLESGDLNVYRDFIDINDLIAITWRIINNKSSYGEVYNICSGKPILLLDIVKYIISKTNSPLKLSSKFKKIIANEMSVIYGDNTKLLKTIGNFKFIKWTKSIDRVLENL